MPTPLRRIDRRLLISSIGAAIVIFTLAGVGYALRPAARHAEAAFYTPGVTPKREDCVIAKMKTYNKLDKQMLQNIAFECELTVQSIEGHEKLRQAWEERQAVREAGPKPATPEATVPAETDRMRRVWR
ncbi:hypothetical protein FNB15_02925 [Ferrovibrio terrae]|uniref:Uncharacterized protein n=1 Tax=Ferrovibrio terrae TaxID=2594003 RepID=A0A516GXR5_9PROT|nr:hypothetical protein [Ferrovibrio terrae]QDO96292.1 hypothetical protein FNB15_02925 [Ferrovibrio terrae]